MSLMNPWKIITYYQIGSGQNAQTFYDELFQAALVYKFKNLPRGFATPVDNQTLTDAIFNLTNHDILEINGKKINGQKVKELFVTTILLKRLETKFNKNQVVFIVIPETETSCDTAIFVTKPDTKFRQLKGNQLKLDGSDHMEFHFQVKEFTDFKHLKSEGLLIPKEVVATDIAAVVRREYKEEVLIFLRDFFNYHSEDFKDFFKDHPNYILISMPDQIVRNGVEPITLDPDNHNYIVTLSDMFTIESFNRPSSLLTDRQVKRMVKKFSI